ncbi:MAG: autotransporter-associated beta strand repeat-containing protein, partial [Verrucomicrobiota bacterium]
MKTSAALRLFLAGALAAHCATHTAQAATLYWDGTGTDWNTSSDWSTAAGATTPNPGTVPGAADIVTFSISSVNSAQTVDLNGNQAALGLAFLDTTADTTLLGGGTNRTLTLGTGGITVGSLAGAVILGSAADGQKVDILLAGAQTWTNQNLLTLSNGVNTAGYILTLSGATGTTTLDGVVTGSGGLTKTDVGTLTLTADNTYSGLTTISNGTLLLGADGGATNSPLGTTAAGTTVTSGGALDLNGFSLGTAEGLTLSGTGVAGGGALTNSSYGAATYKGLLALGGNASIVASNGDIVLSHVGTIIGLGFGLTLDDGTNAYCSLASSIGTGTGTLTKSGAGTWTLSGASTYTGQTTVNGGTLQLGRNNAIKAGNPVTINSTTAAEIAILDLNGFALTIGTTGVSGLTLGGPGATDSGANQVIGSGVGSVLTLAGGSAALTYSATNNPLGATLAVTALSLNSAEQTLTIGNSSSASEDLTISSVIQNGSLTKAGAGTLALYGTNTYSGATTLNAGTLSVGADANLGAANPLVFNGGTLQITGTALTSYAAGKIGTHPVTLTPGQSLSLDINEVSNVFTISQILNQGAGGLTKLGEGTVRLAAANTYTGLTTVNGGTLQLGVNNALPAGNAVVVNSTTAYQSASLDLNGHALTLGGGLTLGGAGATDSSSSLVIGSGAGSVLTLSGGANALTYSAASNFLGAKISVTTIDLNGGEQSFAIGDSSADVDDLIISSVIRNGALTKTGAGALRLEGANTFTGLTTIAAGTLRLGVDGDATNSPLGTTAAGTLVMSGAALDLNGYSLGTAEALTLNGSGVSGSGALTNSSSQASTYSGLVTLGSASSIAASNYGIVLSNPGTITGAGLALTLGGDAAYGSNIASIIGTGTVTKTGSGAWTLSGKNTYSGLTLISEGTLMLGATGDATNTPLGTTAAGTIVLNGGALDLNGFSLASGEALTLNGTGVYGGGALTNSSGTAATYPGVITLGSASSIVAANGDIILANPGTLAGSNFGLTLGGDAAGSIATVIGPGAGTLTKIGTGTWTLAVANTYTGLTLVNEGTLRLGVSNAIPSGNVVKIIATGSATAALDLGGFPLTLGSGLILGGNSAAGVAEIIGTGAGSVLTLSGGPTALTYSATGNPGDAAISTTKLDLNNAAQTLTIGNSTSSTTELTIASIIQNGSLTKYGAGVLSLTGTNTYTGSTLVAEGTLRLGGNNTIKAGNAVTLSAVLAGELVTLDLNGFGQSLGALILGGGTPTSAALVLGSGLGSVLTLTGSATALTYSNANNPLGAILSNTYVDLNNAAQTFTIGDSTSAANDLTISAILRNGSLIKAGSGTLNLSGVNTYSGTTTVSAGVLTFANRFALYGGVSSNWTPANLHVGAGATLGIALGDHAVDLFDSSDLATLLDGSHLGASTPGTGLQTGAILGLDTTAAIGGSFTHSSAITNPGTSTLVGLNKLGSGTLVLSGPNSYTGTTTLSGGILYAGIGEVPGFSGPFGQPATAAGSLIFDGGTLQYSAANAFDYSGRFITADNAPYRVDTNGRNVFFASGLSALGSSGLTKSGGGTLTLAGAGSYTGLTTAIGGSLKLGVINAIKSGNALTLYSATAGATVTLDLNSFAQTIGGGGLSLGGATPTSAAQVIGAGAGSVLTLSGGLSALTYSATNNPLGSIISTTRLNLGAAAQTFSVGNSSNAATDLWISSIIQNGSLVKAGAGTLLLTGTSTYTGSTTLSGGTLGAGSAEIGGVSGPFGNPVPTAASMIFNGGTLQYSAANSYDYSGRFAVTLNSPYSIDTNGRDVVFASALGANGTNNLIKSGAGTLTLSGANTFTGITIVNGGTLTVSGATGTINAPGGVLTLNASLTLDNTGVGNNNNNRITDSAALVLNSGTFLYKGADAPATNSSETIGAISGGGGAAALTIVFGATNTATLTVMPVPLPGGGFTAGGFSHSLDGNGAILVNGPNLGKNSTDTSSISRILLTTAPTLTGTTVALASGINAAAKDTQIVPFLVGEAALASGGTGTATGVANTFVTYVAGAGLRPLNPTDEFANNRVLPNKNTYITAPTTAGGSMSINSLVINGGDLNVGGSNNLSLASGALLFASTNRIVGGTLTFTPEAMVTVDAGVTATVAAKIMALSANDVGYTSFSKTGGGNLILSSPANSMSPGKIVLNGGGTVTISGYTINQGGNTQTSKFLVGNYSANNIVNVTGRLTTDSITVGEGTFGGNSLNIMGIGTDGSPTVSGNGNNIHWVVGGSSSNNSLTVSTGAVLKTSRNSGTNTFKIGDAVGSTGNSVTVTGAGARWFGSLPVSVGNGGSNNFVTVSDGGYMNMARLYVGSDSDLASSNNAVLITDLGSVFSTDVDTGYALFQVAGGVGSSNNSFTVANGATALIYGTRVDRSNSIGPKADSNNNYARITGVGSLLTVNIPSPLTIGGFDFNNNSSYRIDSNANGNHLDIYGGALLNSKTLELMGVNSAFNLGDGTGLSIATVAKSGSYAPGVILSNADSRLNFNSGKLIAGVDGALVSGLGQIVLNGPAIVSTSYTGSTISNVISGSGSFIKEGIGVLTLSQPNASTGATIINAGTLTLDYSAASSSMLKDSRALILGGGTLNLSSGSHVEIIDSTTLNAGRSGVTVGAGTPVLHMNAISPGVGIVNFGAASIASTSNANDTSGILGAWATMGGSDWASRSGTLESAGNYFITAYTGYIDINARGTSTIASVPSTNVRLNGDGTSGNIALGATTTTINTLLQNNANFPATVATAGSVLATNGIMIGSGKQTLTIGAAAGNGSLRTATAGANLVLNNLGVPSQAQVETTTVVAPNGTTADGICNVVITSAAISGSPITVPVSLAILMETTVDAITAAIRAALAATPAITSKFNIGGSADGITATRLANSLGYYPADDATFNIAIPGGLGITAAPTSTNTTAGVSGALTINAPIVANGSSGLATAGLVVLNGVNTYSGSTGIGGVLTIEGAGQLNGGNYAGDISLSYGATLTMGSSANQLFGGVLSGAGGFIKAGTGTTTLSGANTYTGTTTINAGTLTSGNTSAFGAATTASLVFGSGSTGKVQLNGNNLTLIGLNTNATVGSPIIESGSGTAGTDTLTLDAWRTVSGALNPSSYGGVLRDGSTRQLALIKNGPSMLTLAGNNSYSGGTTVTGGTLSLANRNGLGSGPLALDNGTIFQQSGFEGDTVAGALPNAFVLTGDQITFNMPSTQKDIWLNQSVAGTGTMRLVSDYVGRALTLSGAKTFSGGIIQSGTGAYPSVAIDNVASLGSGMFRAQINSSSTNLGVLRSLADLSGGTGVTNAFDIAAGARLVVEAAATESIQLSGAITGGGNLVKTGTANLILSGANTYAGTTTITGGTLSITRAAGLSGTSLVTVGDGASLNYAAGTDAQLVINGPLDFKGFSGSMLGGSLGSTPTSASIVATGVATVAPSGTIGVNVFVVPGVTPVSGSYT